MSKSLIAAKNILQKQHYKHNALGGRHLDWHVETMTLFSSSLVYCIVVDTTKSNHPGEVFQHPFGCFSLLFGFSFLKNTDSID